MASETKFTPGPWRYDGHEVWGTRPVRFNLTTAGTPMIAEVCKHSDTDGGFPFEANARLIAAAPELYLELEMLCARIEGCGLEDFLPEVEAQISSSREALAKARGEA